MTRPTSGDGDLTLTLDGLPAGASAEAVTLAADVTAATLTIVVDDTGPIGSHNFVVDATLGDVSASAAVVLMIEPGTGDIDPRFGNQGFVELPLASRPSRTVALQSNGRVLVVELFGQGFIVHGLRSTDGQPDPSFGTDGTAVVLPMLGTDRYTVADVELTDVGDILLVGQVFHNVSGGWCDTGSNDCDGLVVRLTADGQLDADFASDGVTAVNLNCYVRGDRFDGATVMADGSLVAVGCEDFAIARLLPNGTVAPGFPFDAYTDNVNSRINPNAIDVYAPDATSFIAYRYYTISHHFVRYTTGGTLITSYGTGGLFKVTGGWGGIKGDPLVMADGTAIMASSAAPGLSAYAYSPTGAVATGYGIDGTWSTQLPDPANAGTPYAVAGMANGDLVVAGDDYEAIDSFPVLARFSPTGTLVETFGEGGINTALVPPGKVYGLAVKSFELADGALIVVVEAWDAVGNAYGAHLSRIAP